MADPNFLNQQLIVKIQPARVFLNSLRKMMKLAERAVLIVKERDKFQILAISPNLTCFLTLDMESELIIPPLNPHGHSLLFRLENWCHSLSDFVSQDPLAFLYIVKSQGSNDLHCVYGTNRHEIKLEDAQFVIARAVHLSINDGCVRVRMNSQRFREFIRGFARLHRHRNFSAVQVHISGEMMRWIGPFGQYDAFSCVQTFVAEGLAEGARFRFGLRWDWELFDMLCSVSTHYNSVVISVFQVPDRLNLIGFRFSVNNGSHSVMYLENEHVLQQ